MKVSGCLHVSKVMIRYGICASQDSGLLGFQDVGMMVA